MKNYIRENFSMLAALVAFAFLVLLISYGVKSVSQANDFYEQQNQSKQAWFQRHSCVPIGYTGKSDRIYKCDDGLEYIWRDLPTMKSAQ